VNTTQ